MVKLLLQSAVILNDMVKALKKMAGQVSADEATAQKIKTCADLLKDIRNELTAISQQY